MQSCRATLTEFCCSFCGYRQRGWCACNGHSKLGALGACRKWCSPASAPSGASRCWYCTLTRFVDPVTVSREVAESGKWAVSLLIINFQTLPPFSSLSLNLCVDAKGSYAAAGKIDHWDWTWGLWFQWSSRKARADVQEEQTGGKK